MSTPSSKVLRIIASDDQLDGITGQLLPEERTNTLIKQVDRITGKRFQELIAPLGKELRAGFLVAPVYIGAEPTDLEEFVSKVWDQPITDQNYKQVLDLFRLWWQIKAPDQYHAPAPVDNVWGVSD